MMITRWPPYVRDRHAGRSRTTAGVLGSWPDKREERGVTDELAELREAAAGGDRDAEDQLVELAGERGDLAELRRLAEAGNSDAVDVLVELAGEREDLPELRRLAAAGSTDARDVLVELVGDEESAE
jgi:hypothetical protein